jgi:hypothetical protein
VVRKWMVRPRPETGLVERQDVIEALVDAAAVLDCVGGALAVVQQREPTEVFGEMVTTAVLIEWKDRTDARSQPEAAPRARRAAPDPAPAELEAQLEAEAGVSEEEFLRQAEVGEDLSSVEAAAR